MNDAAHRAQVSDFLRARRAAIPPERAGLLVYGSGSRRVPGLRREEVALLAGISVDYYVRMERGNLTGASDSVLDGVANALQLDAASREHLFDLARAAGPSSRRARPTAVTVRPVIQQVLDAMTGAPAWVRNARHDMIAVNALARALYAPLLESTVAGATAARPPNTTRFIFLDPRAHEFFVDHDRVAVDAAGKLRLEAGRHPHDAELVTLVGELSTRSELFRQLWASQNVSFHRSGRKRLRHPVVGELELNYEAMELPGEPGLHLNVHTADPGSPTADALALLASWTATAPDRVTH